VRPPSKETLRIRTGTVKLLRRTMWKCGYIERKIIKFLLKKVGHRASSKEIIKHIIETYGPTKGELLREITEAIRRLERRYVIKVTEEDKDV